jgi:membrane associated rhomboid family serine protease
MTSGERAFVAVKERAALVGGFVLVLWVLELADVLLLGSLDGLGIRPRETFGLLGIPLAPFLHGGFGHLLANTTALIPLGLLVSARRRSDFVLVSALVALLAGGAVWLLGAGGSVHIGASGLVFGYLGYLVGLGFFERSPRAIVLALVVGFAYGGLMFGVLPGQPGVSWESHLFGFIAGVASSKWLAGRRPRL